MKPIEKQTRLTDEWHLKLGALRTKNNDFEYVLQKRQNSKVTIVFALDNVLLVQGDRKLLNHEVITIWNNDFMERGMYVEEFIKLYFALSGIELKVSE